MRKALTTKSIEALKAETALYIVPDLACPNLNLIVQPTGRKTWIWRGRVNTESRKFTLGRFPVHTLADAREWAREITRGRDAGVDVVNEKKRVVAQEQAEREKDCDWLFALYMRNEGDLTKSAPEKWRLYNREIRPSLGSRSVSSITHDDLANLLQAKLLESASVSNHMQALIKRWFRWAVTIGRHLTGMTIDPAANVVKLAKQKSRDRFLSDQELGLLLRVINRRDTKLADPIKLILHTGVRRAEAFELPWSEIADLAVNGRWVIPGSRTKNGQELALPLPDKMIAMLLGTPRRPGQRLVWEGGGEVDRPMSGFSKAVAGIHFQMQLLANEEVGASSIAPWSLHDIRRSVASGMNGLHDDDHMPLISSIVVERILNHVQPGIQGVYNRWSYMAEKKTALRLWANHLIALDRNSSAPLSLMQLAAGI